MPKFTKPNQFYLKPKSNSDVLIPNPFQIALFALMLSRVFNPLRQILVPFLCLRTRGKLSFGHPPVFVHCGALTGNGYFGHMRVLEQTT